MSDTENTHYVVSGTSEFEVENLDERKELCGKSKFECWFNMSIVLQRLRTCQREMGRHCWLIPSGLSCTEFKPWKLLGLCLVL